MQKKIIIGIIVVCMMVFLASLLKPVTVGNSEQDEAPQGASHALQQQEQFLPWQIDINPAGFSRVFGITLGETTLQEANSIFHDSAEVSLFVSPMEQYKVEAYFDKVILGGFSAKIVLVINLPQDQLATMYARGSRVSSLGSGRKKVTIAQEDLIQVMLSPVASLTYLTHARVDDDFMIKRFGEPSHRVQEQNGGVIHWLYPERGLDVVLNDRGNAVFQYISPGLFDELMAPLLVHEQMAEPQPVK